MKLVGHCDNAVMVVVIDYNHWLLCLHCSLPFDECFDVTTQAWLLYRLNEMAHQN